MVGGWVVGWLARRLVSRLVGQLRCVDTRNYTHDIYVYSRGSHPLRMLPMEVWSVGRLVGWLVRWLVGWWVGLWVGRLVGRLLRRLVGWLRLVDTQEYIYEFVFTCTCARGSQHLRMLLVGVGSHGWLVRWSVGWSVDWSVG